MVEEILTVIEGNITNHPRSQQKRIGPSEIGMECTRRLIHKLAGDTEPDRGPAWKPTVGTACHSQMEQWFELANQTSFLPDSYLIEQRVNVGRIGETDITGSTDLFMPHTGTVVDWKFVGPSRLKHYRLKGPSDQYRVQAHLYGKGWVAAGYTVQTVMIAFIPRDGELGDSFFWSEPYNPMVAVMGLARANQLHTRIQAEGKEAVLADYPLCGDRWCPWCHVEAVKQATSTQSFFTS